AFRGFPQSPQAGRLFRPQLRGAGRRALLAERPARRNRQLPGFLHAAAREVSGGEAVSRVSAVSPAVSPRAIPPRGQNVHRSMPNKENRNFSLIRLLRFSSILRPPNVPTREY